MNKNSPKILVIIGPTSSGKSDAAIKLARKFNGEIISADSRQIYKGMDIGTGKIEPDKSDEITQKFSNRKFYAGSPLISGGVPHYLIDIVSPKTDYNVSKFKKDAEKVIKNILKRGKLPIICGGTGFWIKAIVDNVDFPEVKPDTELRRKLGKKDAEELFKMLEKLDPERAKNIDSKNKVRLIRAIEICKTLGSVPKIQDTKYNIQNTKYDFLQIGINISKEQLHKNIEKRLKDRFKNGMIKEVEKLKKSGLSWEKIQSFGLGYFWIPLYLQKKFDKKELFEKVYQAEKDYAKRQMTWLKKDERIKWLPVCRRGRKSYKEIEEEIKTFIKD